MTRHLLNVFWGVTIFCCYTGQAQISLHNDGLNFALRLDAAQGSWAGVSNGVIGNQSVVIESLTPGLQSLVLDTAWVNDDLRLSWGFTGGPGSPPTFPMEVSAAVFTIADFDWRDGSGIAVESGTASVQILSGNWYVVGLPAGKFGFRYFGPTGISSPNDLELSARFFNSVTVPEPSITALLGSAVLTMVFFRGRIVGTWSRLLSNRGVANENTKRRQQSPAVRDV